MSSQQRYQFLHRLARFYYRPSAARLPHAGRNAYPNSQLSSLSSPPSLPLQQPSHGGIPLRAYSPLFAGNKNRSGHHRLRDDTVHTPLPSLPLHRSKRTSSAEDEERASQLYAHYRMVLDTAAHLDAMSRVYGYSMLRITSLVISALLLLGYLYREEIKNFFSHHGADVTTRTLSSKDVQMSAEALSKSVVEQVLGDQQTLDAAVHFLSSLAQREEVQQLLIDLLVVKVLQDERSVREVSAWVKNILAQPQTQEALVDLVSWISKDETFQQKFQDLGVGLLEAEAVHKSAVELGTSAVHQILDDPAVQLHFQKFLVDTMQDTNLRKEAGDALWHAIVSSFTPTWYRRLPFMPSHHAGTTTTTILSESDARQTHVSDGIAIPEGHHKAEVDVETFASESSATPTT